MKDLINRADLKEYIKDVLMSLNKTKSTLFYKAQADEIVALAMKIFEQERCEEAASKDDVDEIYSAYPAKCVVTGRSLGKSSSDKKKINILLRTHNRDELLFTIRKYTEECKMKKVYMKNFSTFLNNLPDYEYDEHSEPIITIPGNRNILSPQ